MLLTIATLAENVLTDTFRIQVGCALPWTDIIVSGAVGLTGTIVSPLLSV